MKILSVVGARPQFIKAAVISREIKLHPNISEVIIHSGQHYDKNMSDIFFEELEMQSPKYNLGIGSGLHGAQTGKMLQGFEDIFLQEKPDICIVYGDTNSTLAASLAAAKMHISIAHVEAGLRSFNKKMPEEINRIMTDHVSEWLFAPTETAMSLLRKENLQDKSHFVGDVMYDSALFYLDKVKENLSEFSQIIPNDSFFLSTIHRAENTDSKERLSNIVDAFNKINKTIILPLHPRTKKYLSEYDLNFSSNVKVIDPVSYKEIIALIHLSEKVLTDSGGLQKEAYFLKKPCITMRDETEWTETLENGWNILAGANKDKIINSVKSISPANYKNHYGNGNAGAKIIEIIKKHI